MQTSNSYNIVVLTLIDLFDTRNNHYKSYGIKSKKKIDLFDKSKIEAPGEI